MITSSATNLAEVLADLWDKIVVLKEAPKERSIVLAFPSVKALASPTAVNRLLAHMDICKDACDDFGSEVKLIGLKPITPRPLHPFTLLHARNGWIVSSTRSTQLPQFSTRKLATAKDHRPLRM